jgi:hypothetical protein
MRWANRLAALAANRRVAGRSGTAPGGERGLLYIATGPAYVAEAIVSARSVKTVWPDIPIALFADAPPAADCFDEVELVQGFGDIRDKARFIPASPFERTVFLDTDTYCCAAFPEMFDLLDRFDLAAAYADGRFTTQRDPATGVRSAVKPDGIPDSFPELNAGVIAFRRSAAVDQVFRRWFAHETALRDGPLAVPRDQPPLRAALYESRLQIGILPSEYNFRLGCPGFACTTIKIIHGRWAYAPIADTPLATFQALDRTFNRNAGPRVFVPRLGMIYGHGPFAHAPADPERRVTLVAS